MAPSVDQSLRKAKRLAKSGETEAAAQLYRSVLEKYPQNKQARTGLNTLQSPNENQKNRLISLFRQGNLQQVVSEGEALRQQFPDSPFIPSLLAEAHIGLSQLDKALAYYQEAIRLEPANGVTHNNVGIVLQRLGRHPEAIACFTKALELKPQDVNAKVNLGNSLKDIGELQSAANCYESVIQKKPDHVEVHNSLGAVCNLLGQHDKAVECFGQVLRLSPDHALAHNNLAVALNSCGKFEEALSHFHKSLELSPRSKDFWLSYGECLRGATFTDYKPEIAERLLTLLDMQTLMRPAHLARPILSLLKHHAGLEPVLRSANDEMDLQRVVHLCSELTELPLILRLIEQCPLFDLELENLLRLIRRTLLLNIDSDTITDDVLSFQMALALQCFVNEYVFGETAEEATAVQALEASIAGTLANGEQPSLKAIACLAGYRPLSTYEWSDWLQARSEVSDLLQRQITDIQTELNIRNEISSVGAVENSVSKAVQAQYEDSPYPRWIHTALAVRPTTFPALAQSIKLKLANIPASLANNPSILIAGCGTGQQALVAATRFANSRVHAVDLSMSSLSYAIRKTRELGIKNIDYSHADILALDSLDTQYDLIECLGVLHHMAEPMAGWKILSDRLNSGGVMKIGLYSELARQSVVRARQLIAEMGLTSSNEDMLNLRTQLIEGKSMTHSEFSELMNFSDFYSTSELRDLLFHVQEHRFELPQIKQCIESLNLRFAGFEFWDGSTSAKFTRAYPSPDALQDLDRWHEFELAKPDTFRGMYQFWLQKV